MKKIFKIIFVLLFFFLLSTNVEAKEKVKLYFFHGNGCPHCAEEEKFIKKIENKYNIKIEKYEVWYNKDNQVLMEKVKNKYNIKANGVPLTIIANTYKIGYTEDDDLEFERIIKYYIDNPKNYNDTVGKIKNNTFDGEIVDYYKKNDKLTDKSTTINIPLLGKVNMKKVSIWTAAAVIGLVDGFNPCAMWVLLFLLSMILTMKNRKRAWIIGLTFLIASAFVYMLIMLSWINIVVNISTSILFRNLIAVVAIIGAILNIRNYLKERKSDDGCEVIDTNKRKKILTRIKKFTTERSLILALLGVIVLAISVNVVELACSAGLPLIFTQILAINSITGIEAFMYTLIYILFFLIDDIIVFIIAMVTAKMTGISTKYNKYSHLIGGIIMMIIGILLIIKPEWLMFNFK